jgi:hypothetical protein
MFINVKSHFYNRDKQTDPNTRIQLARHALEKFLQQDTAIDQMGRTTYEKCKKLYSNVRQCDMH